ncbi:MAG: TonB-dependent receptor [Gammaproteobacteria bacterium]|nr:TonB-dependent receptor [Gammaproteobacteria bacterium]
MKKSNYQLATTAIACAWALGVASPVWADAPVSGRIVDSRQQLLAGAEVSIVELQLKRTTAADGRFVFPQLPAGSYTLQVHYLGAAITTLNFQVAAQPVRLADVKLAAHHSAANTQAGNMHSRSTESGTAPGVEHNVERGVQHNVEHIVVTGQSGAMSKALNRQRNAGGIVTVASTDELGQFPDSNVSEALQRLAGLSVERDQGEGRFIRVRGLAPDYNAVTYNGTQLAAPEAGRRAVALDVIPSDLLESVEVNKTLTPDMPAGSLGGTVEIKSLSAFDRSSDFYSVTAEGGYNQLVSASSPKISGVYSTILDAAGETDVLGIALAGSYAKRKFGSDNVETGGSWDFDEGLEEFELRDYEISRERIGLALNLDYRPGNDGEYYLRSLYSRFTDAEARQGLIVEFANPLLAGNTGEATLIHSLKHRDETQSISALVVGTKQRVGNWEWLLEAGTSKADEKTPFHIAGADFAQDFDAGVGFSGQQQIRLTAPSAAYLADGYEFDEVEMGDTFTKETERNVRFDLSRELIQPKGALQLKTGFKVSQREKSADEQVWAFKDLDEVGISALGLSDYAARPVDYGLGLMGPGIDPAKIYALVNGLDRTDFVDEVESQINNYQVDEDLAAAYVMAQWEREQWQLIGGVRYEHEQRDALGVRYDDTASANNKETFSQNQLNTSHGYWLPALIGRYNLSEQSILRAAVSTGLVRPNFQQLAPAYLLEEDDGELEASFGNPTLKALRSTNYDLGFEHYAEDIGVLSGMLFYKKISNFIYEADVAGQPGYEDFGKAETYINGAAASLYGLELNAVHQLSGYDNWLDHLLVSANLTITGSEAQLDWLDDDQWQQRNTQLPSQSDRTANLAVGYESDLLSLRLAANYKSAYLAEVGDITDSTYDVYADDHLQLDFSSKYKVNSGVQLYFNIVNLNDEPYYAYTGRQAYNFQYETYGRTFVLGLQITNW